MDRKAKERLVEAKVIAYLIKIAYEVYLSFSNNSKYAVFALKEERVKRVNTKFTSVKKLYRSWVVEIRQIYRRIESIIIDKFDETQSDLIAVYRGLIDKVAFIKASKVIQL